MQASTSPRTSNALPLQVAPGVEIPDSELSITFVRGSGPGGQNVNKVATAAQLRFDLLGSPSLSHAVKMRMRPLSGRRLTDEGALLIIARNHRTQEGNRREALERLADIVRRALVPPKPRKATRPTRASKERRLDSKARRQRTKRNRSGSWEA